MINLHSESFLDYTVESFLIPSERVAHVQVGNNLEHALLVLTQTGYTAIPVLDTKYRLHGLISTPLILDAIMGMERIEFEKLDKLVVEDVMNKNIPTLNKTDTLREALKLLINHPFVCIVGFSSHFEGILTRRVILKQLNAFVHKMHFQE